MTTVLDRHEQRKLETRQKLLDAAEQVFGTMGYETASVLDITEAANVSKRTFYLHFSDKESVIEALAMSSFIELRDQIEENKKHLEAEANDDHREGIYWVSRMIFEFAESRPDLMQIVFGKDGSFRLQAMARQFMADAWEDNIHQKCNFKPFPIVPPVVMANAMAGIIFQLMCWWTQHPNTYSSDAMAKFCVSMLCDGIEVNLVEEPASS